MFNKRTIIIDGQVLEDTSLEKLHYSKTHGMLASNTIPIIFELATFIKPKVCVIIGTGDGLIPRVIREAQIKSLAKDSKTYLIDLGATMGAMPDKIHNTESLFRKLYPEIIVFKGRSFPNGFDFISKLETTIDLLWIDGDHSHKGSLDDFDNYSKLLSDSGLIFLHDTAPNGLGGNQPAWCGVHKTIEYIKHKYKDFECINFTKIKNLDPGMGVAIVKKNLLKNSMLEIDKIDTPLISGTCSHEMASGLLEKNWDYLYSKQFLLRQQFVSTLLTNSEFVLDIGCFPSTVGKYLHHNNYLAVDPLYRKNDTNIRNCYLKDLVFDTSNKFDLVLLGFDMPCDEILLDYCKHANRIIIEYAISYKPTEEKVKNIIDNVHKKIVFDFTIDFSAIPINVDLSKSWPPRYVRRIVMLE